MADYILVKDEQGNLKYYKDGKYFEIEEIEGPPSPEATARQGKLGETKEIKKFIETKKPVEIKKPESEELIETVKTQIEKPVEIKKPEIKKSVETQKKVDAPVAKKELPGLFKPRIKVMKNELETKIDEVIKTLKVNFTDENLKQRFLAIVRARLTNDRDDQGTLNILKAPRTEGGLGLTDKHANLVTSVVKKFSSVKPAIEPPVKTEIKPPISAVVPPPVKPLASPPPAKKPEINVPVTGKLMPDQKGPIIPLPEDRGRVAPPKPIVRQAMVARNANSKNSDFKYSQKLVGPVEELRLMDLDSFHRLGVNPSEIAEEILEKVALLTQEGFTKHAAGVSAWQDSPIYKIYTDIGVQSVMTGKPIADVIVERQVQNLPTITQSEFEAIIDLNKKLGI
jgi:hypothetical protein